MILQFLRALVATVEIAHGHSPDSTCYASNHSIFWIQSIGEEEGQVGGKFVDIHATTSIVFDVCEAVCKRECELANRVGPCLSDMVSGDADRVVVSHSLIDVELLDIAHQFETKLSREDAGVLCLVFLEDISLNSTANRLQSLHGNLCILFFGWLTSILFTELGNLLSNGRVEEHRQYNGCGAIDGHRNTGVWITEVKATKQCTHLIDSVDADAGFTNLPIDVGSSVWVSSIQGDAIEGCRQSGVVLTF